MAATELAAEAGEGETTLCSARGEPVCKTPLEDANEHAEPVDNACKGSKRSTGEGETKLCTTEDDAVMRERKLRPIVVLQCGQRWIGKGVGDGQRRRRLPQDR